MQASLGLPCSLGVHDTSSKLNYSGIKEMSYIIIWVLPTWDRLVMGKASYFINSKVYVSNVWSAIFQQKFLICWPENAVQVTPTSLCSCHRAGPSPAKPKANHVFFFAVHRLRVPAPFFIYWSNKIDFSGLQSYSPQIPNPYLYIVVYSLYSYLYIAYSDHFFLN